MATSPAPKTSSASCAPARCGAGPRSPAVTIHSRQSATWARSSPVSLEERILVVFVVGIFVILGVVEAAIDGLGQVFQAFDGGDGLEPGVAGILQNGRLLLDHGRQTHGAFEEGERIMIAVFFDGE